MSSIASQKLTAYLQLMRLDKPVGTLLLLWSSLWGLWLAGQGQPPARIVWIFLVGTFLMRSAGCVFNDIADRNFDGKVERTAQRPLATGVIHLNEALAIGITLLLLSFALVLQLNWQSVLLSVICASLALIYPFCKRFFATPQLVLGFSFASPILMAHTAILGKLTLPALCFFIASSIWALVYDTYYALVDREDDIPLGLRSSAIFAQGIEFRFILCMICIMFICLLLGGWLAQLNDWYYLMLALAFTLSLCLLWHSRRLARQQCYTAFSQNNWIGACIWIGLVLAYLPIQ